MKFFSLAAMTLAVTLTACGKKASQDTGSATQQDVKSGSGRGLVKAISASGKSIVLSHNDVPGVMEAMTMTYPVADPASLSAIHAGDSITFTMTSYHLDSFVVSGITPIPRK